MKVKAIKTVKNSPPMQEFLGIEIIDDTGRGACVLNLHPEY